MRQKTQRRKVRRGLLQERGCTNRGRRTSPAQQYYRRQTNPPQITSTLHRKHGRLLLSPRHRQGRLSLRTSSSRTTDPFGATMKRRIRDGRTALRISRRGNSGSQMETSTMTDVLRTTACDRCPQHHVRRCLPPFRRQLQGRPAVSSYQGLQQGRGGLHPVRHKHHTRHHPQDAYAER